MNCPVCKSEIAHMNQEFQRIHIRRCKKEGLVPIKPARKYRDLSKIEIVHHELDETIDPAFVKELHKMVANKLFTLWKEQKRKETK